MAITGDDSTEPRPRPIHTALSHLAVWGLRGIGKGITLSPPPVWGFLASAIAAVLWRCLGRYRRVALRNLLDAGFTAREAHSLGKQCFRSNLLVVFESLAMPRLLEERGIRLERRISPKARQALERIRSGAETVSFGVGGHTGVWELLGAQFAQLCAPVTAVVSARLVKNPILSEFLVSLRRGYGMHLIEKQDFMRFLLRENRNKSPHIYVFLCDQHFRRGVKVPFFGRKTCAVSIPAVLIRRFDGPVFMGRCIRIAPGHYRLELDLFDRQPYRDLPEEEAVYRITAAILKHIETTIAMAPEQWTWGHRIWRDCCKDGGDDGQPVETSRPS